jgi:hypothetical protein
MNPEMRRQVDHAVNTVNTHQGETCVYLQFEDDAQEIDFMASSARMEGESFEFSSGCETLRGSLGEVRAIRAEIICR